MANRRVSVRLTPTEWQLVQTRSNQAKLSMSAYLKRKLLEPKIKMDQQQLDRWLDVFSSHIDAIVIKHLEWTLDQLVQQVNGNYLKLSQKGQAALLQAQWTTKQILERIDQLSQQFM